MSKKSVFRKDISSNKIILKDNLLRIVKTKEGKLLVDLSGKLNGRGAYIKPNLDNLYYTKKNRLLEKSLKCKINNDFFNEIELEIKKNGN